MAKKQPQTDNAVRKSRNYKKHFVLYNNGGVLSATTPKNWARGNRNLFPGFNFINSDNTPTVDEIELVLSQNGFSEIINKDVVIKYEYIAI